jgi:peroxiredoxin Q/BCP
MVSSVVAVNTTTTNKAYAGESLGNVNVGDKAPQFTLPATGGGQIALSDILAENDYAVVYFYNQDGSTGCSIEAERFNQAQEQFKAKKARVLGVSMDSIESHEGFCDKKGLTFSLLSDGDGAVSKAYGAELTLPIFGKFSDRQTFLVGKDGLVKAKWKEMGAKVDEEKMASVKSTAHVEQVLAKM